MSILSSYVKNLPESPGVYLFRDNSGRPLYVGKSTNVRQRVKSHKELLRRAKSVEAIPVKYELEALLLEAQLIKKHLPRLNSRAKDDKHPLYIKITTDEEFPKVSTSRREEEPTARYWGPFPSSSTVKQVLRNLRKIFPFCAQKRTGKKACFWAHLGLCRPCPAVITTVEQKRVYSRNIKNLTNILDGKTEKVTRALEKAMQKAAESEHFEQAADLRDQLRRLSYITAPYRPATAYLENPNLLEDIRKDEQRQLAATLHLKKISSRIECFDASHLQGEEQTASMVTFIDGEPEKNLYRRFKIKGGKKRDDFASMSEVVKRRLAHIEDWGASDLVVVDGGKPQLSAARAVLREAGLNIPIVGLAKRLEEVVLVKNDKFETLRLPRSSPALQLLQRLRDEAHRFTRSYHLQLRIKTLHNVG